MQPRWARKAWLRKQIKKIMDSQDAPHSPNNQARDRLAAEKAALAQQEQPPRPRLALDQAITMILQRLSMIEVLVGRSHDALMRILEASEAHRVAQDEPPPGVEDPQESEAISVDAPAPAG
jgi:hypothetical protein